MDTIHEILSKKTIRRNVSSEKKKKAQPQQREFFYIIIIFYLCKIIGYTLGRQKIKY